MFHKKKIKQMKKIILSAMMIMAMTCLTTNVSAQDNGNKKAQKECCEKKQEKKCCDKKAEAKPCCKKKAKDCKKCTECKPECGENGCKECPNNHQCKKNCKK